jgi:hypothetical protein
MVNAREDYYEKTQGEIFQSSSQTCQEILQKQVQGKGT